MTMSPDTPTLTAVAPQVLLGNHLKALKLPCQRRRQIVPDSGVKVYQSG